MSMYSTVAVEPNRDGCLTCTSDDVHVLYCIVAVEPNRDGCLTCSIDDVHVLYCIVAVEPNRDGYLRADLRAHMTHITSGGPPPSPALSIVSIGVSLSIMIDTVML